MDPNRIPHNLQGLFRFCINSGSDFDVTAQQMDPERARWLREALSSMEVDLVEEIRKQIRIIIECISHENHESSKISDALDILLDLVEDIDMANLFLKIGGLELLLTLFEPSCKEFFCQAGLLLSNVVQNNESAQIIAINNNFIVITLRHLETYEDKNILRGILSCLSALLRGCSLGKEQFLSLRGFQILLSVLHKISLLDEQDEYSRVIEKASFLVFCLCQEMSDDQLSLLVDEHLPDKIVDLLVHLKNPSEFLLMGLTLLLMGRDQSSGDKSVEAKSNYVPVRLQLVEPKLLRDWLDSWTPNPDSEIESGLIYQLKTML